MKKPHEPKVIQVSEKDRKHMLKLHNEVHKRDEDIGEILRPYTKRKAKAAFHIPRFLSPSRKAAGNPKTNVTVIVYDDSVGIYDEVSGR